MPRNFGEEVEALLRWKSQLRIEYRREYTDVPGERIILEVDGAGNFYVLRRGPKIIQEVYKGLEPYRALAAFYLATGKSSGEDKINAR